MNLVQTDYLRKFFLLFGALALLTACSLNPIAPITGIFSGGDDDEEEGEEDDGRISILALDTALKADPRYSGVSVEVPAPYVNTSWPQPGGEADHTLHHLTAGVVFERLWRVDIGSAEARRARLTAPPIVVSDRVYVIDARASVSSYDVESGDKIWETDLEPEIKERFRIRDILRGPKPSHIGFGGGVAFDQGRIFVSSGFGFVAALDAISGEEIWRVETDAPVRTPPTAHRGLVFVNTNTNQFLALNQETGEREWTFSSFEESARFLSASSPAAAGDLVVAPFSSGEVIAFITDNGRAVWNQTLVRGANLTALASLNDISGSPVIDRGLVYVVSHGGQFSAIDIRSGDTVWEVGVSSLQMPWVAGEFIFIVSVDGELAAVSRNDGGIVWVTELERYKKPKKRKGRITWAGPVLAGGSLILVSSEGKVVKVDPTNGVIGDEKKIGGGVFVSPVVAGEKVFILTEEGKLIAMR